MKNVMNESLEAEHTYIHTSDLKNKKGITLVALVITIIILLILAGITISTLTESGLFKKTKLAKEKTENSRKIENATLVNYENNIDQYLNGARTYSNYELLATFNSVNEEKEIKNIKNYKEFEIVILDETSYFASDRYNVSLYTTDRGYMSNYNSGTPRTGQIIFIDETKVKADIFKNIEEMRLYGIN